VARLYRAYREARRFLQRAAIGNGKRRSWSEVLATLDSDPWRRPYRSVMNKLRPWAPPVVDPRFLEGVVGALFPGTVVEEADVNNNNSIVGEEDVGKEEESPRPPENW
jgi:hypothetical protein